MLRRVASLMSIPKLYRWLGAQKPYLWIGPGYIAFIGLAGMLDIYLNPHPTRWSLFWMWLNIPVVGYWAYKLGRGASEIEKLDQEITELDHEIQRVEQLQRLEAVVKIKFPPQRFDN